MASYRSPRRLLILVLISSVLMPAVRSTCTDVSDASVALGETAEFYICDVVSLGSSITVYSNNKAPVDVTNVAEADGWLWETTSNADGDPVIRIYVTVDSVDDFDTYSVQYLNQSGIALNVTLNVTHKGPPEPCDREAGDVATFVQGLAANLGTSARSTLCVVSQTDPQLTIVTYTPADCKVGTSDEPSTFSVTAERDPDNPVVYELVFEVTSLSDEDIGNWTVGISNADGAFTVNVVVEDNGPSLCVKDASTESPKLEADFFSPAETAVFVFSAEELQQDNISVGRSPTLPVGDGESSLVVQLQPRNGDYLPFELVLQISSLTGDSLGDWLVTVSNAYGSLTFNVTVEASGSPQLYGGTNTDDLQYVQTLSANLGSSGRSTLAVLSEDMPQPSVVEHTPSDCKVGTSNGPSTFNVTAVQDPDNPVVYELVFEVTGLSDADIGWWKVAVNNKDGSLTLVVIVQDNGPTLCSTDMAKNALVLKSELYTEVTSSVLIFSLEDLQVSNTSIKYSSDSASALAHGTVEVDIQPKSAFELYQELTLYIANLTETHVGNWTVTVTNSFSSLEFDVSVSIAEAETAEEDGDFKHWLLPATILASLIVSLIILVVVIVVVCRVKRLGQTDHSKHSTHAPGSTGSEVDNEDYLTPRTGSAHLRSLELQPPTNSRPRQVLPSPTNSSALGFKPTPLRLARPEFEMRLTQRNGEPRNVSATSSDYEAANGAFQDFPSAPRVIYDGSTYRLSGPDLEHDPSAVTYAPYDPRRGNTVEWMNLYQGNGARKGGYRADRPRENGRAAETFANRDSTYQNLGGGSR